jgi:hypothetical protein
MAYDVDYTVRMCEALRPYRMAWMEEMLMPHDWKGLHAVRQRVPWQILATGEHWTTRWPGIRAYVNCKHSFLARYPVQFTMSKRHPYSQEIVE